MSTIDPNDPLLEKLNATMTRRFDVAPGLAIFRVETDGELFEFIPGQYCVLGMPPSASRVEGAEDEEERTEKRKGKLIRRAYSIASSSKQREYLEFYITMVNSGELTPRLFDLQPGDRTWLGPNVTGHFTLGDVPPEADLYLIATGTGLAPHISMLKEQLANPESKRRMVIVHGARHAWDLGYRPELEVLARKYERVAYIPSITRPGEDGSWAGETGYIQAQLQDGRLERLSGIPLDPANTHVFLCGNPAMIETATSYLVERGFSEWSKRKNPEGTVHSEKYW